MAVTVIRCHRNHQGFGNMHCFVFRFFLAAGASEIVFSIVSRFIFRLDDDNHIAGRPLVKIGLSTIRRGLFSLRLC